MQWAKIFILPQIIHPSPIFRLGLLTRVTRMVGIGGVPTGIMAGPAVRTSSCQGTLGQQFFGKNIPNNKAMWLEQNFSYPNWGTGSLFNSVSKAEWNNQSWYLLDDAGNPVDGPDTAQSIIDYANQMRVTIDYKLVDLGTTG
jgi:hypothetical protein